MPTYTIVRNKIRKGIKEMNSSLVSATSLPSMHDEDDLATNFRVTGGKSSVKMTKKQVVLS